MDRGSSRADVPPCWLGGRRTGRTVATGHALAGTLRQYWTRASRNIGRYGCVPSEPRDLIPRSIAVCVSSGHPAAGA
eukprot:772269-Rhodomonas_salina.4